MSRQISLSAFVLLCIFPFNLALGGDRPIYQNGVLAIQNIDTADQVGKYQDVYFKPTDFGLWQLIGFTSVGDSNPGAPSVGLALLEKADVIKTDSFPTQVLLRISGTYDNCGEGKFGQINQRLENNKFTVQISYNFIGIEPPNGCVGGVTAFVRTVPLPVYGLNAGTYSYSVNMNGRRGVQGTFELNANNKLPGDF